MKRIGTCLGVLAAKIVIRWRKWRGLTSCGNLQVHIAFPNGEDLSAKVLAAINKELASMEARINSAVDTAIKRKL